MGRTSEDVRINRRKRPRVATRTCRSSKSPPVYKKASAPSCAAPDSSSSERGFLVVDGQKVKIRKPRVRSVDGHEETLDSYELFRRNEPLDEAVWDKLMLGLSTRNYARAVHGLAESYGIKKSAVSEHFIRVSRRKVRELMERNLSGLRLCAINLDGIEYKGRHMFAALGVHADGAKTVLGLRQGASENAVVVSAMLGDLANRGVDFFELRLYFFDGAKALVKAVREHAGTDALIQCCQVHKRRNVCGYLGDQHRDAVETNGWRRRTLATNPIESAFSVVETVCRRVKCWQQGDHAERWVGLALWVAEGNSI